MPIPILAPTAPFRHHLRLRFTCPTPRPAGTPASPVPNGHYLLVTTHFTAHFLNMVTHCYPRCLPVPLVMPLLLCLFMCSAVIDHIHGLCCLSVYMLVTCLLIAGFMQPGSSWLSLLTFFLYRSHGAVTLLCHAYWISSWATSSYPANIYAIPSHACHWFPSYTPHGFSSCCLVIVLGGIDTRSCICLLPSHHLCKHAYIYSAIWVTL